MPPAILAALVATLCAAMVRPNLELKAMTTENPDLQFWNHGSFVQCAPETEAGKEWAFNNLLPGSPGIEEAIGDCMWPVYI